MNIFIFWLSLLPLIVWSNGYEAPKIIWFLTGNVVLIVYWIYKILKLNKNFEFTKADVLYFAWLFTLTVSSAFGVHPFESIIGGSYRHQGVIFFFALWLVGKTIQTLNQKQKMFLAKSLGIVVIAETIIVLFQYISGNFYFGKPLGTLGEAGAVAGFIATGSYFVFISLPKIYLILIVVSILLTESRAGILAALASFGIWGKKFAVLFAVLVAALLVILISFSKGSSPFENRITIWKLGINQIAERPIFGYGAESGQVVFNNGFYKSGFPLSNLIIDRAHNLILDVTLWSGVVGLIFFSGWLYFSFKRLGLNKKFAFLSFLVYSMFQPLSVVHWILLIIIANI